MMHPAPPEPAGAVQTRPQWRWFAIWTGIGAGVALAFAALLSIGIFLMPLVVGGTVLATRRQPNAAGMVGIVSGIGLPLLFIAYLNRGGPGWVCSSTRGGQSCAQEYAPWPFLIVGLGCLAAGLIYFWCRARRPR